MTLVFWSLVATAVRAQDAPADDGAAPDAPESTETQQGPAAVEGGADAPYQITVYGEREVLRRRMQLDSELRRLGYDAKERKDGKQLYVSRIAWKPNVVVYDDGYVVLRRSRVQFKPPDVDGIWGTYLTCVLFSPVCVKLGGQMVSKTKLDPQKAKVAEESHDEFRSWQDALVALHMQQRIEEEIPAMLDATWASGAPLDGAGSRLESREERRQALLSFWASRADTPEGREVRRVVERFLRNEVMTSPWPLVASEVKDAEAACGCTLGIALEAGDAP